MANITQLEEKHLACQKKRRELIKTAMVFLGIWAVLLIPAFKLGMWILLEITESFSGKIIKLLGGFVLIILVSLFVNWPVVTVKSVHSSIKRLTYALSMELMALSLEETLGAYTADTVTYRVIQSKSNPAARTERNQRLSWRGRETDFLMHRARITETDSDDNTRVCFDGMAFSVPVKYGCWSVWNHEKKLERISRVWEDRLYIDGKKPTFCIDQFEDGLWLSVGYAGLRFGEDDIPWRNLEQWYQRCSKDARIVKQIRDGLMEITAENG